MSRIVPDTAGARSLISSCGLYRYWYRLDELSDSPGTCCFIMLNPATKAGDSPAKRQGARKKCQRFAREHDFGTLLICHLFAYRSRNPKELRDVCDPIGPAELGHDVLSVRDWNPRATDRSVPAFAYEDRRQRLRMQGASPFASPRTPIRGPSPALSTCLSGANGALPRASVL